MPSSVISAKKWRQTIELESLEIPSRKLEIPRLTFHEKMGTIKDRNGMDITKAESTIRN